MRFWAIDRFFDVGVGSAGISRSLVRSALRCRLLQDLAQPSDDCGDVARGHSCARRYTAPRPVARARSHARPVAARRGPGTAAWRTCHVSCNSATDVQLNQGLSHRSKAPMLCLTTVSRERELGSLSRLVDLVVTRPGSSTFAVTPPSPVESLHQPVRRRPYGGHLRWGAAECALLEAESAVGPMRTGGGRLASRILRVIFSRMSSSSPLSNLPKRAC